MPTGYTDMIDRDPKMTTKKWMMEGLARAFGVCVALKEEPFNLTEDQIRQKIIESGENDVGWHQTELTKAVEEKVDILNRTPEQWETAWKAHEKKREADNKCQIRDAKKIADRHNKVKEDLEKVLHADVDDFTKTIAKYGLEQLHVTEHECEPYLDDPIPLEKYKYDIVSHNLRDIEYHTKEKQKAEERLKERVEGYITLRKDLDRVLG